VRTLRERIDSILYERTALSKQHDALIRQGLAILRSKGDVTLALVRKDPYELDFLGLTNRSISFTFCSFRALCSTHAVALSPFHPS
jgi:predicted nuclease of restriction endonuclease-like (RecB) superfamily